MQNGRIYQGPSKSGTGNWYLRFRKDVLDAQGKPIRKKVCVKLADFDHEHRTEASVRHLAEKHLAPVNARTARPESIQKVVDFIEHVFLPKCAEDLRPSTFKLYNSMFNLIKPHLDNITLTEFRLSDADRVLKAVADSKPRSHASLRVAKAFLSSAFRHARRTDRIDRDPIRDARIPRGLPRKNTYAYSVDEIKAVLRHLTGTARAMIACAAFSGLRISEIRGLQWADITEDGIKVQRGVWEKYILETKSLQSNAAVPLLPILKRELDAHHKRHRNTTWVFESSHGKPQYIRWMMHDEIWPAFTKAKVQWQGWHAFRRGVATTLSSVGVDDTLIRDILRHSNVTVTQGSYIRPVASESQAAMRRLEKKFR